MATKIIDYSFGDIANVANPDDSYKAKVKGCTVVTGPGVTPMGQYPKAFRLTNGYINCDVADPKINAVKFTLKLMVRVENKVTARQNLAESTHLPFSVFLDQDPEGGDFIVQASISTKAHDWGGVNTRFRKKMQKGVWYEICVAYDTNTLGLFVDRVLVGICAFPVGTIEKKTNKLLAIGAWTDMVKYPFSGDIAGFQWMADIPQEYELAIDNARDSAAWQISYKYESIKSKVYLGSESTALRNDTVSGCQIQEYKNGWILYHTSVGAFEIHGAIFTAYKALPATKRKELGWLVSDEMNGRLNQSKKSLFKGGAIYWSPSTPAVPVLGQMYLDYETMEEGISPVGLPLQIALGVSGGTYQKFQKGRMYHKTGAPKAFEVHGTIMDRYDKLGHCTSFLGWPISDESDIRKNNIVIGKFSAFEGGTIYWKSGIGAFETHGSIAQKYEDYGGPTGPLGFPRTNEADIPNHTGPGKYNVFEGGIVVWYGSFAQTFICPAFKVHFQRIETSEQEALGRGENDIFMHLYVYKNGIEVFHVRRPNSGDYGDHNTVNVDYETPNTFFPDSPDTVFKFRCNAWDEDGWSSDDEHLGDLSTDLDIHNAWGQRDNDGLYVRQAIKHMKITWSVKPQLDPNQFTERQWNFWGVANRGTNKISWDQYAAAFRDVTGDPDTIDHIFSPLDYFFYKLAIEDLAKGGNCFGMCLEAINAWKKRSIFNGPLNRYTWDQIKNEVNIKHCYQLGANAIWWFVGQFISGNTHNPKNVYTQGKSRAAYGDRPIYCITQNSNFSGKPHAILPWKWDKPEPWKVEIFDPNNETGTHTLVVNSAANTYSYNTGYSSYSGGAWSGGRFYYFPWSVVNGRQRTPIWDALLLLLAGTIIILGDSSETTALTSTNGENLDGGKMTANDASREKFFVPFHTLNSNFEGQMFLRQGGAVGASFIHNIKGKKAGKFEYLMKNLASSVLLESSIQPNEVHNVSVQQLGLASSALRLNTSVEKSFKIRYFSFLGNTDDHITIVVDNVRAVPGQEIKVIPKTGVAGIEIEGMNGTMRPKVDVEVKLDNKITRQSFTIDASKAIRMDFSRVAFNQELKVINLDRIGGNISSIKTFKSN